MDNFITYEYNSSIPLDLIYKNILMFGRADDKFKRFELGILAMEYIIEHIPEVKMKIITNITNIEYLKNIINYLCLEKYIHFVEYTPLPEKYFQNISLNIITSISESFSLALSETKLYGIPNIFMGLDYISTANGGTINIYDDSPEYLAKESIKLLTNYEYRQILGKEARKSMKKFENKKLLKKWVKLLLSIYTNDEYYEILRKYNKKISEIKALNYLKNQFLFFKKRKKYLKNITLNEIKKFLYNKNIE